MSNCRGKVGQESSWRDSVSAEKISIPARNVQRLDTPTRPTFLGSAQHLHPCGAERIVRKQVGEKTPVFSFSFFFFQQSALPSHASSRECSLSLSLSLFLSLYFALSFSHSFSLSFSLYLSLSFSILPLDSIDWRRKHPRENALSLSRSLPLSISLSLSLFLSIPPSLSLSLSFSILRLVSVDCARTGSYSRGWFRRLITSLGSGGRSRPLVPEIDHVPWFRMFPRTNASGTKGGRREDDGLLPNQTLEEMPGT